MSGFLNKSNNGGQSGQGAQGAAGAQGSIGAQGSQGSQGVQGSVGAQGAQGAQGNAGSQGAQGQVGAKGDTGNTGLGFVIAKVYNSEAERLAASGSDLPGLGEFALIAGKLSTSDADYGKLYLYSDNGWVYQTDMSIQGIQGPQGVVGSQGVQGSTGTQGVQGSQGSSANTSYDISMFYSGTPGNSEVILQHIVGRNFSLSQTVSNFKVGCLVNPTGAPVIKLSKISGGVTTDIMCFKLQVVTGVLTLTYRNSTNTADVNALSASNAAFLVGDMLVLTAPASADATLADIYVTLIGTVS